LQLLREALLAVEKRDGLIDGQLQHFVDVQAVVADFEDAGLEAGALALLADQLDIGQKLHLHRDGAIALAGFAAPAGNVEREVAGGVAALFGVARGGEELPDQVEHLDISHRVGARGAADGRLIDHDGLADRFGAFDLAAGELQRRLQGVFVRGAGGGFGAGALCSACMER
jgi:hypothetical protein